ncbi:hypothetical protein F4818DRAFT_407851 [Hypoxylon cercidicola]|nr:hypothetical protein F4818DRAFT_407851 [Hypoxylon cercidicola]
MKERSTFFNCIANFLFASLLGMHVLAETFRNYQDDLVTFIDAFVRYAQLHRDVRAVTNKYWDTILRSNLQSLLQTNHMGADAENQAPGTEISPIRKFLKTSKLRSESIKACQGALNGCSGRLIYPSYTLLEPTWLCTPP